MNSCFKWMVIFIKLPISVPLLNVAWKWFRNYQKKGNGSSCKYRHAHITWLQRRCFYRNRQGGWNGEGHKDRINQQRANSGKKEEKSSMKPYITGNRQYGSRKRKDRTRAKCTRNKVFSENIGVSNAKESCAGLEGETQCHRPTHLLFSVWEWRNFSGMMKTRTPLSRSQAALLPAAACLLWCENQATSYQSIRRGCMFSLLAAQLPENRSSNTKFHPGSA